MAAPFWGRYWTLSGACAAAGARNAARDRRAIRRGAGARLSGGRRPPASTPEEEARAAKSNDTAIRALLKEYYQSRKQEKLLYRHSLCGGKGKMRDGSECAECCGCGSRINLFHFRKAFWGVWSPGLRDAPGALESLRAFHARAQRDPSVLGELVKAFRVESIEPHGYWARATVQETTTAGKSVRSFTLISVGSRWFFYHPEADAELLPRWREGS
ncbi:MAG: hypothetical protein HC813_03035 [Planctomycetes bacterium]|nr:hypothetical protein [Planctomycetota bacterium]